MPDPIVLKKIQFFTRNQTNHEKKFLKSPKPCCILDVAVTLIAMKLEVAAAAGNSMERMSSYKTGDKSLYAMFAGRTCLHREAHRIAILMAERP